MKCGPQPSRVGTAWERVRNVVSGLTPELPEWQTVLEQIPFHRECLWIVKAEKSLRSHLGREMIHSSRSSHMVRKV